MASPLTPDERRERQRTDHRLIDALDADPCPIRVTGHRSAEDVRANRDPVLVGDQNPPSHYRVVYDFDTLRGPGVRHRPTVVHVAPLANGAYPASSPSAWVISDVMPWTPHFAARVPICHGDHVWMANRTQLVDYIIHIGKLLNFDEPPPNAGYHGYNREAVDYWATTMRLAPLDPDLRFPTIDLEDVLGGGDGAPAATPRAPSGARRFGRATSPVASTPTAPTPAAASPGAAVRFRPAVRRDTRRFGPAPGGGA
jgi:hypothetical protein